MHFLHKKCLTYNYFKEEETFAGETFERKRYCEILGIATVYEIDWDIKSSHTKEAVENICKTIPFLAFFEPSTGLPTKVSDVCTVELV